MLVDVLRKGLHAPPYQAAGWLPTPEEASQLVHAPKIGLPDRQLQWKATETRPAPTAIEVETRDRVVGRLWSHALLTDGTVKRVILEDVRALPAWPAAGYETEGAREKGKTVFLQESDSKEGAFDRGDQARTEVAVSYWLDGHDVIFPMREGFVRIGLMTLEGEKPRPAARVIQSFSKGREDSQESDSSVGNAAMLAYAMSGGPADSADPVSPGLNAEHLDAEGWHDTSQSYPGAQSVSAERMDGDPVLDDGDVEPVLSDADELGFEDEPDVEQNEEEDRSEEEVEEHEEEDDFDEDIDDGSDDDFDFF
jgi:hypothetical protein